jgi:hypothetical protein
MSTMVCLVPIEGPELRPVPAPLWAVRLDRSDIAATRCSRIFNYNLMGEWEHGYDGQFIARFRAPGRGGWCYVITFADGSRGTCQVRDFERALAAAGARVDLEAE